MSNKYFIQAGLNGLTALLKVDDSGVVWLVGMGENDPEYLAWLAEGNTPEPWEA